MKLPILAVSGVLIAVTNAASAEDYYTLNIQDAYAAEPYAGTKCSEGGGRIVICNGGGNALGITTYCVPGSILETHGCILPGGPEFTAFCVYGTADNNTCHDTCGGPTYSAWTSDSANRVKRDFSQHVIEEPYKCKKTTSIEYGCAANYYKSAGSGASMTCTICPSTGGIAGQNQIGDTDITTCCIPAGTAFSDTYGSGKYTEKCCYTK